MNDRQPDESGRNLSGTSTLGLGHHSRRRRRSSRTAFGKPLVIGTVLLGAAIAAGAYFGVIDPGRWTASWFDDVEAGVDAQAGDGSPETLDGLAMRIRAAERALGDLVESSGASQIADALSEDMTELSGNFSQRIDGLASTLESYRTRLENVTESLGERIRAEVDGRTAGLRDEMGEIRTENESRDAEIAKLKREIELLRQEIAAAQAENKMLWSEVDSSVARLSTDVGVAQSALGRVEANISREEADFILEERRRTEVAAGILVYVFDADAGRQRATGTLHIVDDGRVLTFENQPVGQAFVFSTGANRLQHELVFTRVTRDQNVAGYVRIPDGLASEGADARDRAFRFP